MIPKKGSLSRLSKIIAHCKGAHIGIRQLINKTYSKGDANSRGALISTKALHRIIIGSCIIN